MRNELTPIPQKHHPQLHDRLTIHEHRAYHQPMRASPCTPAHAHQPMHTSPCTPAHADESTPRPPNGGSPARRVGLTDHSPLAAPLEMERDSTVTSDAASCAAMPPPPRPRCDVGVARNTRGARAAPSHIPPPRFRPRTAETVQVRAVARAPRQRARLASARASPARAPRRHARLVAPLPLARPLCALPSPARRVCALPPASCGP